MAEDGRQRGYAIEIGATMFARRLRAVLADVKLDCAGRQQLEAALDRFVSLESERSMRDELRLARQQLRCIAALIKLLEEIDDISPHETDTTVYGEFAALFDDVAVAAQVGSTALRALAHFVVEHEE